MNRLPVFLLTMCIMLAGCQRPLFLRQYRDVPAEEFMKCYDGNPPMGILGWQFKYIGIKNGYHVIDFYDMGTKDWLEYRYSIRTKKDDLPSHFPNHPQQKQGQDVNKH
jgi:hypothetical protein